MDRLNTQGWVPNFDVQSLCTSCENCLRECRMSSCAYDRPQFPSAMHCPNYIRPEAEE